MKTEEATVDSHVSENVIFNLVDHQIIVPTNQVFIIRSTVYVIAKC